jgi:tRNA threonylcarbamoyladenosine biosynthesis protein TsaE
MQLEWDIDQPPEFVSLIEVVLSHVSDDQIVLLLEGEVGAGKTTFTQVVGAVLGVTEPITSPTFTIMRRYETSHPTFRQLVHIDAYRFEAPEEARPLGLAEVLTESNALVCVEWPERIPGSLPAAAWRLCFEITDGETRRVTITPPNTQ